MEISNAEFIISNTDVKKCPAGRLPEYAFIGRSNVGKSSLINMLTGRKGLAMTSATPGKTMLINHFLINNSWYIVDRDTFLYHIHKGRQTERRTIENEHQCLSAGTAQAVGRTPPLFCFVVGRPDGA